MTIEGGANVCCVKFNPTTRYNLAFGSAGESSIHAHVVCSQVIKRPFIVLCQYKLSDVFVSRLYTPPMNLCFYYILIVLQCSTLYPFLNFTELCQRLAWTFSLKLLHIDFFLRSPYFPSSLSVRENMMSKIRNRVTLGEKRLLYILITN